MAIVATKTHNANHNTETTGVIRCYKNLASAIILKSVEDYIEAKKFLETQPKHKLEKRRKERVAKAMLELTRKHRFRRAAWETEIDKADETIEECTEFFKSDRFKRLTNEFDGEAICKILQETDGAELIKMIREGGLA